MTSCQVKNDTIATYFKTLPYPLPDGTIKPIPVKVIPSSIIISQMIFQTILKGIDTD